MIRSVLVALLALVVVYGLIEAWPLLRGPVLAVTAPTDHTTAEDGMLTVRGTAKHVSVLTLNGAPVLYDQAGHFSSTLTFPSGGSILTFRATDRFGRSVSVTRTIFVP